MADVSLADTKVRAAAVIAAIVVLIGAGVWWVGRDGDDGHGRQARSPEQAIYGYVEAYREGDCRAMAGLVSRDVSSDGGEQTRREYLHRCRAAVDGRAHHPDIDVTAGRDVEPPDDWMEGDRLGDEDRITVPVRCVVDDGASNYVFTDEATLVRERGDWRLDVADDVELTVGEAGPLDCVDNVALNALVVNEPVAGLRPVLMRPDDISARGTGPITRAQQYYFGGVVSLGGSQDMAHVRGFGQGFRQLFASGGDPNVVVTLTVLEFSHDRRGVDDAFGELRAALDDEYVGDRFTRGGVSLDTAPAVPDGAGFVIPEVDEYGRPLSVYGLAGATVMGIEDDVLVVVEVDHALGRAASEPALEVLAAQLARLRGQSDG